MSALHTHKEYCFVETPEGACCFKLSNPGKLFVEWRKVDDQLEYIELPFHQYEILGLSPTLSDEQWRGGGMDGNSRYKGVSRLFVCK